MKEYFFAEVLSVELLKLLREAADGVHAGVTGMRKFGQVTVNATLGGAVKFSLQVDQETSSFRVGSEHVTLYEQFRDIHEDVVMQASSEHSLEEIVVIMKRLGLTGRA